MNALKPAIACDSPISEFNKTSTALLVGKKFVIVGATILKLPLAVKVASALEGNCNVMVAFTLPPGALKYQHWVFRLLVTFKRSVLVQMPGDVCVAGRSAARKSRAR